MPASSYKTASSAASKLILLAAARLVVTSCVSFKDSLQQVLPAFFTTEGKLNGQRNLRLIKKCFLLEVSEMDE